MEKTNFLDSDACDIFYDWMGMNENGTFKEGATGDNFLAFHKIQDDIDEEIREMYIKLYNDMHDDTVEKHVCDNRWEKKYEYLSDVWENAKLDINDIIEDHCDAKRLVREAIYEALKYNMEKYDYDAWIEDPYKVKVIIDDALGIRMVIMKYLDEVTD